MLFWYSPSTAYSSIHAFIIKNWSLTTVGEITHLRWPGAFSGVLQM